MNFQHRCQKTPWKLRYGNISENECESESAGFNNGNDSDSYYIAHLFDIGDEEPNVSSNATNISLK